MQAIEIEFPGQGRFTRDWLETHPDQAQVLLSRCKGRSPVCLCRTPGLPLYIALRSRYYLARHPNSGPDHIPACPSYEPEAALCGWGIYSSKALEHRGDGRVNLKLGVPLTIRGPATGPGPLIAPRAATPRLQRDTMQLRGLLHLLWERAEFNRWRPAMQGRRRYRQIYKYLLEAAEGISIRREVLTRYLYIPEPFDPTQRLEIEARRQRAFLERSESASGIPMRILVVGQVRAILQREDGIEGLGLAHLPRELVLRAPRGLLDRLRQETEFAWIDWPVLHMEFRLITLLTMQRARQGHWSVGDLASMVTTEHYIPVCSMEEALVAKRLVLEDRQFYKPLSYDALETRLPNFLLVDRTDLPMPLEILGRSEAEAAVRQMRIEQYRQAGRPFWVWDAQDTATPPPLEIGDDSTLKSSAPTSTAA